MFFNQLSGLLNLVALLSLMNWNNIALECSKFQRWVAQTTVFIIFKLTKRCKDIVECSTENCFKYYRIVMPKMYLYDCTINKTLLGRRGDELQCIIVIDPFGIFRTRYLSPPQAFFYLGACHPIENVVFTIKINAFD